MSTTTSIYLRSILQLLARIESPEALKRIYSYIEKQAEKEQENA